MNNHHDGTGEYTSNTSSSDSSANNKSGTALRGSTYKRSRCRMISEVGDFQPTATHPSSKMPMVMRKTVLICIVSALAERDRAQFAYIELSIHSSKARL